MNSKIRVSGNIIGELSEKIPSNIIALNELIKNAYDAGANKVTVTLDSVAKMLIIEDNGSGMNKDDIDTLFHISNSKKVYGKINEFGRHTQGSKGLGFLSVFKFGEIVEWNTKKDRGLRFSVNYQDLISSDDISQFEIEINEINILSKGTKIKILLSEYNAKSLLEYFSKEKYYKKVINAFDDDNFEIDLIVDQKKYSSKDTLPLRQNSPDSQLYYITYSSKDHHIKYYFNNHMILSRDYPFYSDKYTLEIELLIFQLAPYGKSKIDQLYYNPQDDLTPLIYVNSNLFNNFDLFDPNVMKNIKTSQVLNQMIGFVRIISDNNMINFNSDRSQFLQNELTDSIKEFLREINKKIQEIGSAYKKYLMDYNFLTTYEFPSDAITATTSELKKYIKSDFSFKDKVTIHRIENEIVYSLFGKEKRAVIKPKNCIHNPNDRFGHTQNFGKDDKFGGKDNTIPASIKLTSSVANVAIPSTQIDLKTYIKSVNDSTGKSVDFDNIHVKVDGQYLNTKILPSITTECQKKVEYIYTDSKTGNADAFLILKFYQPESDIDAKDAPINLISLPSCESYTISFNPYVGRIISELNNLNISDYIEVIACSLRSIFEISVDCIRKSTKYESLLTTKGLDERVSEIIGHIKNSTEYRREISLKTKIDFDSLKNLLDPDAFKAAILKAHLGAHKSMSYITENDVKHLAKMAGVFVVVVNEMLSNDRIN